MKTNIVIMEFPRGSEWRKWDLHVHTPESILYSEFGDDWDHYIKTLFNTALQKEIAVIGITDYFYIEGYKKIKSIVASDSDMKRIFKDEATIQKIRNIKLLPNIELRLFPINGQRLNFHVIFSDEVSIQNIEENFLHNLNFVKEGDPIDGEEKRKLKKINLEELGKKLKEDHEPFREKSDLYIGMMNAVVDDGAIVTELMNNKSIFAGRYVLVVCSDEDLSNISWDGQDHNTRKKMIQKCHFLLSSNPSTIQWGLGNKHKSKDDFIREFKTIKPCLWGSDSHKYENLFEPDLQRYTWIKSDPTFAGLKQVLNEPSRVFIGAEPPNLKNDHQIIKRVIIRNSNGWFKEDFQIDINPDLLSVIGGRGSGKSALLEMIAVAGGATDESEGSFLNKAEMHTSSIKGTEVELEWKDGKKTKTVIGSTNLEEKLIQFLPQQFVEKLCAPFSDQELLSQIEDVIFQALDETEKQGASDFKVLVSKLLKRFEMQKNGIMQNIRTVNKRVNDLRIAINEIPEKEKVLSTKQNESKQLSATLPKLSIEDKKDQEKLAKLNSFKDLIENRIIEIKDLQIKIPEIKTRVAIFKENLDKQKIEINALLNSIGITEEDSIDVSIQDGRVKTALKKKEEDLEKETEVLKSGTVEEVKNILQLSEMAAPNLDTAKKDIEELLKQTKAHETVKMKYQLQTKEIEKLDKEIILLKAEIESTKNEKMKELSQLTSERLDIFCSFFKILLEEKEEIEKLYKPLQESLNASNSAADKSLQFEAKIIYDADKHWEDGLDLIDRSKKGRFRSIEALKDSLHESWRKMSANNFQDLAIRGAINDLIKEFSSINENGEEKKIRIEDQLRQNHNLEHFANWILDANRYKVVSSLKFDGTELTLLSPGQKGIVLLILYLHIDRSDTRPLLIDQPEDNLDNLSVYDDLIQYFRDRKSFRQIIVATHNPNLVVNTDSEQICISSYEGANVPRIKYKTGSLENCADPKQEGEAFIDGIIENVCKILEGGTKAFSSRRKKYQLSPKEI